jgi:hypothetical protein
MEEVGKGLAPETVMPPTPSKAGGHHAGDEDTELTGDRANRLSLNRHLEIIWMASRGQQSLQRAQVE